MGPTDLAELYAATRLNFHPASYDAYGMTIVEAASQGAASVVNGGGTIGATDLLWGDAGEVCLVSLAQPVGEIADAVERVLGDEQVLAIIAAKALARARSWDEAANAAELMRMVRELLSRRHTR